MPPPSAVLPTGRQRTILAVSAALAASAPSMYANHLPPSATFLNQALALGLWGLFAASCAGLMPARRFWSSAPLLAALGLLAAAAAWSSGLGGLPASLGLSAIGLLLASAVMLVGGAGAGWAADDAGCNTAADIFALFCWAWMIAGVLNAGVAILQVFTPWVPESDWFARSTIRGRAVGNLRQPNHLSSLLTWSCIALVALVELRRLSHRLAAPLLALLVYAVVLTASRTGFLSVLLLALWAVFDTRLARRTRGLLLAAPLVYGAAWAGMGEWAALSKHRFGGTARLAEADISGSRFGIWGNTLDMIRAQPWAGVGFGEFNFAWTLTPLPGRPRALFDNAHNLPLHLAVELGLPLAALVSGLLLWALVRAVRVAWAAPASLGTARRCALMMLLMIGLHSLLEYPLWYAYFLLPAAWAWGFVLGGPGKGAQQMPGPPPAAGQVPRWLAMQLGGLALAAGAILSIWDYHRVAQIFEAYENAPPLAERVADGRRSLFFAHYADYAAVTAGMLPSDPQAAFDGATHHLLDPLLMPIWARYLAEHGQPDAARTLAARLRELRRPEAEEFFKVCDSVPLPGATTSGLAGSGATRAAPAAASASSAASAKLPFQCEPPTRALGWRDFLPHQAMW